MSTAAAETQTEEIDVHFPDELRKLATSAAADLRVPLVSFVRMAAFEQIEYERERKRKPRVDDDGIGGPRFRLRVTPTDKAALDRAGGDNLSAWLRGAVRRKLRALGYGAKLAS